MKNCYHRLFRYFFWLMMCPLVFAACDSGQRRGTSVDWNGFDYRAKAPVYQDNDADYQQPAQNFGLCASEDLSGFTCK